jgi:hypothetical protein
MTMSCDWCERPVGASHAVTCPLTGYVTEPAAPSEGGTGDEIAKLRAEIARLRKTADGQIRSRVAEDIAVESAWERCGITPHWPDDEAGSIVSHAESMAMEIARLREERQWISVGERLPEIGVSVLCSSNDPPGEDRVWIGQREQWSWYFPGANEMGVPTHWMPLPTGPEGDG